MGLPVSDRGAGGGGMGLPEAEVSGAASAELSAETDALSADAGGEAWAAGATGAAGAAGAGVGAGAAAGG